MPDAGGTSRVVTQRARLAWMVMGSALGLAACNAIFGMDAPTLNPCVDGCPEGGLDEGTGDDVPTPDAEASTDSGTADSSVDSAKEASPSDAAVDTHVTPVDAAPEAASCDPDAGLCIRCGGGAYPESWCSGSSPVCCQGGSASAPTFTCVASMAACSGYTIECANYNDCSGTEICCRFMAHQVCDVPANCPNDELVCDSTTTDVCPPGWSCDSPFIGDAAASSPYLGCMQ
jgi:hypothetical protein